MQGILYEESSIWLFLLVTVVMGGWTAWMTGRALARSWRHWGVAVAALLVLAVAVRFIHFALFQGTFLSLHFYVVDAIVVLAIGLAGFRVTRARQMASQYGWLYERSGALTIRPRAAAGSDTSA